jgi:hypothetical protein
MSQGPLTGGPESIAPLDPELVELLLELELDPELLVLEPELVPVPELLVEPEPLSDPESPFELEPLFEFEPPFELEPLLELEPPLEPEMPVDPELPLDPCPLSTPDSAPPLVPEPPASGEDVGEFSAAEPHAHTIAVAAISAKTRRACMVDPHDHAVTDGALHPSKKRRHRPRTEGSRTQGRLPYTSSSVWVPTYT